MKPQKAKHLQSVSEDIIKLKFKNNMRFSEALNMFYAIMRKHGIKKGTKSGKGIIMNNFEWTICYQLFVEQLVSHFRFSNAFSCPKDLVSY